MIGRSAGERSMNKLLEVILGCTQGLEEEQRGSAWSPRNLPGSSGNVEAGMKRPVF